jgi:hypothetical protein
MSIGADHVCTHTLAQDTVQVVISKGPLIDQAVSRSHSRALDNLVALHKVTERAKAFEVGQWIE